MKKSKSADRVEDKSKFVSQRNKIDFDLKIDLKFILSPKQQEFVDLILDNKTKIVLCKGPAGTAKSFLSIYAGLLMLQKKKVGELHYLRNPVESSSFNLGFLPGTQAEKIGPYLMPLMDKLHEFLMGDQIKQLEKEERVKGGTIGFLRGASFNATYVAGDEVQNFSVADFLLTMTRMGKFSKLALTGDTRQVDTKNSGFERVFKCFDNDSSRANGIFTFKFGKEDIVREPMIGYILDQFETLLDK